MKNATCQNVQQNVTLKDLLGHTCNLLVAACESAFVGIKDELMTEVVEGVVESSWIQEAHLRVVEGVLEEYLDYKKA